MSDFDEFVRAAKGDASPGGSDFEQFNQVVRFGAPTPQSADPLAADTAKLKAQFATPPPSTGGGLVHNVPPMALQMGGAYLGEILGGPLGQILGSGLGSGAGYLYNTAAEPLMKGQAPTTTMRGLLGSIGLGSITEGGAQALGAGGRFLTGKTGALKAGEEAGQEALATRADLAEKATAKAEAATTAAQGKVETAQEAVNREIYKHQEDAFQGAKQADIEKTVADTLGTPATIQRPVTIKTITEARPAQAVSQKAVKGVFQGISNDFEAALEQHGKVPITESSLPATVKTIRQNVLNNKGTLSSPMEKLLDEAVAGGETASVGRRGATSENAKQIVEGLRRAGNIKAAEVLEAQYGLTSAGGGTVRGWTGLRSRFLDKAMNSANGFDRRASMDMIEAIDNDVAKVTPPSFRSTMDGLRAEWQKARSVLSDPFRNRLYRASSPEQVAEAIVTGAKTGKDMGHRAALLVNQVSKEAPEQLPVLKQAFAARILKSADPVKEIQGMHPDVFKAFYPGTGFDDPKNWVKALEGQNTFKQIAASPELQAKYHSIFEQGMNSLGTRAKKDALTAAESQLRATPNSQQMIADALKDTPSPGQAFEQGAQAGMREPIIGKGLYNYVGHKTLWLSSLALMGAGHFTSHPYYMAVPMGYLMSHKAWSVALSNPTLGRMYYNALTSKTAEQGMFWLGRLTAAGLSQGVKDAQ